MAKQGPGNNNEKGRHGADPLTQNDNNMEDKSININHMTATVMARLASENLAVMTRSIAAYNRKKGYVLSAQECEDLLTEAYLDAVDGAATYNPEKGAIKGWLWRIAHNAAVSYLKKRSLEVRLNEDSQMDSEEDVNPYSWLSRTEREQVLRVEWESHDDILAFESRRRKRLQKECWYAAFHTLSDKDQLLLYMRYDLELGEEEMARQMGMTYGSLRVALSRALDRFQLQLEARHYQDPAEWTMRHFHDDNLWGPEDDEETFFGSRSEANG